MTDIAEILKNAPKGLKLYSLVHGVVTLKSVDTKQENYQIEIIDQNNESSDTFTEYGKFYINLEDSECVLFPSKEHKSWDNWQEVLFQVGDIVSSIQLPTPYIITDIKNNKFTYTCSDNIEHSLAPNNYRYATPEEREQFMAELNANGYTWNDETKQMEKSLQQNKHKDCLGCVGTETKEEPFTIDQFKPFDKVLVRYNFDFKWEIDLFERYDNDSEKYSCLASTWNYCIPYNDETSKLLGTKNDCPKKYKTW